MNSARVLTVVLLLACLTLATLAAPRDAFYQHGDTKLPTDQYDVSSPEITLKVPIVFFGDVYTTIYVSSVSRAVWHGIA